MPTIPPRRCPAWRPRLSAPGLFWLLYAMTVASSLASWVTVYLAH